MMQPVLSSWQSCYRGNEGAAIISFSPCVSVADNGHGCGRLVHVAALVHHLVVGEQPGVRGPEPRSRCAEAAHECKVEAWWMRETGRCIGGRVLSGIQLQMDSSSASSAPMTEGKQEGVISRDGSDSLSPARSIIRALSPSWQQGPCMQNHHP